MSKNPDEKEIALVIWEYCQSEGVDNLSVWWENVGLEYRTIEYRHRQASAEQARATVDRDMLSKGYVPMETAAEQLGMKWEQIALLIKSHKLKPICKNLKGDTITYRQSSRDGQYIALDDIADHDAIHAAYNQVKTVSTTQAAKLMGVTTGTFSKWASRANISAHDEQWTNSGYKVYLWTIEQVNTIIQFRDQSKS